MKYVLFVLYLVSALIMPWWFVVPFGIVVATLSWGIPVALLGAILMDTFFGAPVATLYDFQYVYTAIFLLACALVTLLFERVVD